MTAQLERATAGQRVTSAAADTAIINTAGVGVALVVRAFTGQVSVAPVMVWLAVALLLHAANGVWLAGRTGQSLGDRIAQIAYLSPATGRPVGVSTLARVSARGAGAWDPRVARVSVAPDRDRTPKP